MLFDYLKDNYEAFTLYETELMHDLQKTRNKVVYEGFFIKPSYLKRNESAIREIIKKLENLIKRKINNSFRR